ncbi:hypothetical protein A3759_07910 [Thalassolituus sp. HI0120]|nr:hypothetical protein A3759_07910 [Thalassolituus sp. HI0120]
MIAVTNDEKLRIVATCFFIVKFGSMSRLSLLAASLTLGFSLPSSADFSANIGLASEYVKDGVSLSQGRITPQVGLTYLNDWGAYGGLWASNLDQKGDSRYAEWSGFGGFYFPLTESLALDLGVTRYDYLGDAKFNDQEYNEGFARLLVNDAWTFGLRHASDSLGSGHDKQTIESAYTMQSGSFSIEFYLAQNRYLTIDNTTNFGGSRDDYWHFRFGLGRTYNNWDYRLRLERTNLGSGFDGGTNITFGMHRYFDF